MDEKLLEMLRLLIDDRMEMAAMIAVCHPDEAVKNNERVYLEELRWARQELDKLVS